MLNNHSHWLKDKQWRLTLFLGVFISLGIGTLSAIHTQTTSHSSSSDFFALKWILLLLVYPVLEEFVFRGLVQPIFLRHWSKAFKTITIANILTSALFTLAHTTSKGLHWLTLGVFLPSLVFGYFRDRHQTIASATILHCVFNSCFFAPYLFF